MSAASLKTTRPQVALGQPVLAGGKALRRADMEPFAVVDDGGEPAGRDRLVPERVEGKHAIGRAVEEAAAQNLDPGEEKRHDLALDAAADRAHGIDGEIP